MMIVTKWCKRVCLLFAFTLILSYTIQSGIHAEGSSPAVDSISSSSFRLDSSSTTIAEGTIIKLIVENGVDATVSSPGDRFVARVVSSVTESSGESILISGGSWVTGRVTSVKRPGIFSRAGKLSLELDNLTTLSGEIMPLNASLSFEEGKINQKGVLDPQTGFRDKALAPTRELLSSEDGKLASVATLGIPVVATLIQGTTKATICKGDSVGLQKGEVFSIQMSDNSLLIKN